MEELLKVKRIDGELWFSLPIERLSGSFLSQEEQIQEMLNQIGGEVSKELLKSYDTDGSAIEVEGKKYTSKGLEKKNTRRYLKK